MTEAKKKTGCIDWSQEDVLVHAKWIKTVTDAKKHCKDDQKIKATILWEEITKDWLI